MPDIRHASQCLANAIDAGAYRHVLELTGADPRIIAEAVEAERQAWAAVPTMMDFGFCPDGTSVMTIRKES
jgi:hypothetical protein